MLDFFPLGKTECLGPFDALRNFAGQIAFHFEAKGERQQTPFSLFALDGAVTKNKFADGGRKENL